MPDRSHKAKPFDWRRFARLIVREEPGQVSEQELQTLVEQAVAEGRDPTGVLLSRQGRKMGGDEPAGPDEAA